ncbi:MAG: phosphatidate cytidylyltransferase [Phycisphaerales bacterium]
MSAFLLFGVGFGRLGTLTAEPQYRALLCTIIACCQFSDVAAYCCGKSLKTGKLFPNTSPGKTLGGHVGALLIITPLAAALYHLTFDGTALAAWHHCIILGLLTAILAQLGDLVLSSIKRDIGIKDMGADLPGHGGVLDRCNSLLLAAPVVYHYINTFHTAGAGVPFRLLSGSSVP